MTTENAGHIHSNIKWLYLCNLDNCYTLSVFLYSTLTVVAKATETCRRLLINDKAHFVSIHLLIYFLSDNMTFRILSCVIVTFQNVVMNVITNGTITEFAFTTVHCRTKNGPELYGVIW
jgi:hypothetical protein